MPALDAFACGYDRALAHIKAMTDKDIADVAWELFPDNLYQWLLFASWTRSVQDRGRVDRDPDTYPLNLVSAPGEGKTATIKGFGHGMEIWLSEIAGEPTKFHLVTRSLVSINDLSEILGYGHIDFEAGVSKIFPHDKLPSGEAKAFGSLFLDDWNRATPENVSAAMVVVNTGAFNGWELPKGMVVTACSNPAGNGARVTSVCEAQYTRFIYIAFTPKRELFYEALERMGVPELGIAMAVNMRESIAPQRSSVNYLPQQRPLNKRNFTMFWQLYGVLKYHANALDVVACSVFGSNLILGLEEKLAGDVPLQPHQILGVNKLERKAGIEGDDPADAAEAAIEKFQSWSRARKTDLIGVSITRLTRYLNLPNTILSDEQFDAFGNVILSVDKEHARACMRSLVVEGCPRYKFYMPKLNAWRSADGIAGGPLAERIFEDGAALMGRVRADLSRAT